MIHTDWFRDGKERGNIDGHYAARAGGNERSSSTNLVSADRRSRPGPGDRAQRIASARLILHERWRCVGPELNARTRSISAPECQALIWEAMAGLWRYAGGRVRARAVDVRSGTGQRPVGRR
jgi:hypothetical protein